MISPPRRNLLIVLSIFWLLISWLIASLRPGADGAVILVETLQIFIPGFFLLALLVSIEMMRAEKHTAIIRRDIFGGIDVFVNKSFLYIPFFYEIIARMPVTPLRQETPVAKIDTRTLKLLQIPVARIRYVYQITDFKACLAQAGYKEERVKDIESSFKLKPTDASMWPLLLDDIVAQCLDDNLRSTIWTWQKAVESQGSLALEPLSSYVPRPAIPPSPPPPPLSAVMENDPYDLSLNREKLAKVLVAVMAQTARQWGITIKEVVIEQVEVAEELIKARTRNKDGEIAEAQHKAKIDYIEIRSRGLAEAEVRATTVKRILDALVNQKGLPPITEKTVADIVRAAMYSDGEMIWKGVLEKSSGPPPSAMEKGGTPTPAKTA